jgi:hypothetical protein
VKTKNKVSKKYTLQVSVSVISSKKRKIDVSADTLNNVIAQSKATSVEMLNGINFIQRNRISLSFVPFETNDIIC